MTVKRATRVSERLRDELARMVRDLSDPRVQGAIVARVEMTDDLSIARVHVRRSTGACDAKAQKSLLAGFVAASGRLRRDVGRAVGLRYTPELKFYYDTAPDEVDRVEELLREVERDRGSAPAEEQAASALPSATAADQAASTLNRPK